MIYIFLIDKFRLSWSESQLKWLDLLATCAMFYWVDLPGVGISIWKKFLWDDWVLSLFSPFLLWGHYTYPCTAWLKVITVKLRKCKVEFGWRGDREISDEKKTNKHLFLYQLLLEAWWERAEHPPSGIQVGMAASLGFGLGWPGWMKARRVVPRALGIWLKAPGKVLNQVARILEEAGFKNCTVIIQC